MTIQCNKGYATDRRFFSLRGKKTLSELPTSLILYFVSLSNLIVYLQGQPWIAEVTEIETAHNDFAMHIGCIEKSPVTLSFVV